MDYNEIKIKESKTLLNMAWLLEIIFCTTGLFIAFTLSTSHLEEVTLKTVSSPDILVGLLVLVAVALVELSKIPTVNVFLLSRTLSTKFISGLFLLCVCVLTFETMSTGLEQNVTNRENEIKDNRSIVINLNEQIANISREISDKESLTQEQIYANSKLNLESSLNPLNEQIKELRKRELQLSAVKDTNEIQELKRQIKGLETARSEALSSFNESLRQLNDELSQLNKDEQKEISDSMFTSKIIKRFQERREIIKQEKNDLRTSYEEKSAFYLKQIEGINTQLTLLTKPSQTKIDQLAEVSASILKLQSEKQDLIKSSNNMLERQLAEAKESISIVNQKKQEKNILEQELIDARKLLSESAEGSFIHRMASRIYGVPSAADLTEKQVGTISLIFVFSIALVVAIAGPLLAYCSMNLKIEKSSKRSTLNRSFRKMLVSLRKRLTKPKIVTEIKEVEKEVEKIVEVEVEKKIYETVEVPTPYEVTKFVSVPVPTEISKLPFENTTFTTNSNQSLLGGVK